MEIVFQAPHLIWKETKTIKVNKEVQLGFPNTDIFATKKQIKINYISLTKNLISIKGQLYFHIYCNNSMDSKAYKTEETYSFKHLIVLPFQPLESQKVKYKIEGANLFTHRESATTINFYGLIAIRLMILETKEICLYPTSIAKTKEKNKENKKQLMNPSFDMDSPPVFTKIITDLEESSLPLVIKLNSTKSKLVEDT